MSETMNSLERTRTVLAGAIPDRVPVDLHNFMMLAHTSGMPFSDFFQSRTTIFIGENKAARPPWTGEDSKTAVVVQLR